MSDDLRFITELRTQLVAAAGNRTSEGSWLVSRTRGRAAVFVVTALVVIAGAVLPIRWLGSIEGSDGSVASTGKPSASLSARSDFALTASTFELEPGITGLAYGFGSVWVAGQQSISRLDVSSAKVVATIPFSGGDHGGLAIGSDSVWASGEGTSVSKIDPDRNAVVAKVSVGGAIHGLAIGQGDVWVSTDAEGGRLVQINPATATVTSTSSQSAGPLQYSDGSVWIFGNGSATEVDAATMTVETSNLRVNWPAIVVGGYVWSISEGGSMGDASDSTVVKTDIQTGEAVGSTPVPRAALLGADASGVWALSTPGSKSDELYIPDPDVPATVTLIDAATGAVKAEPAPVDITPARVTVGGGSFWISHYETGVVTRIDVSSA